MAESARRFWILVSIVLLGVYAQVEQALLIRESLVVFYGNEISLGAFFGSWLFWIAIGSLLVVRWRDKPWLHRPKNLLAGLMLLLPPLLLLQVAAMRSVRSLLDIPSMELIPLGDLFVSISLISLPGSLVIGLSFPLACKALGDIEAAASRHQKAVANVSRLYLFEAAGALFGGILFTFIMLQWGLVWQGLGLLSVLLAAAAWRLADAGIGIRLAAGVLSIAGLLLAVSPLSERLNSLFEQLRFSTLQPGMELLDSVDTRYGHVAFARLGTQTSVVSDGSVSESFPQRRQVEQEAAYVYSQSNDAERVLMFGGFAGGLPVELLRYPVREISVVEQDSRAFEALRPLLPARSLDALLSDGRLEMHFLDGRRLLRSWLSTEKKQAFDLVLVLNPVPTSAHGNRYFTLEFYRQIKRLLKTDGVICTKVSSASNYLGGTVAGYSGSVFHTLREVFPHVALMPGDSHLYCASGMVDRVTEEAGELAKRYRVIPLDEHRFPALRFQSLLPPERIRYVREQLAGQSGALNADLQPITYYLNMLLWGQFSASGFADWLSNLKSLGMAPYWIPLLAFLLLWLLRASLEGFNRPRMQRWAAAYSLAVLGMVAMAAQLAILFSYQSSIGFMFERIALLNALFMSGLAIGAGGIGQWLAAKQRSVRYLSVLLFATSLALLALGPLLASLSHYTEATQERVYYSLSVLLGALTGVGFPLGVNLTHRDLQRITSTAGVAEAADSLGGALGGFLTGALLVPILGVEGAFQLLAIFSLSALLPLLYGRFAASRMPGLSRRGSRAFPWNRLAWGMAFVVLTAFGWDYAAREAQPKPQIHFGESRLMQVSGSVRFELVEEALIYYRGWDTQPAAQTAADTASLSSMTVAQDVVGYAGPLNLLVSVDAAGKLRGLHYLDSDETPAYISGIQGWLDSLSGADMSRSALDLASIDALSGATVSSDAALRAINRSVTQVGRAEFGGDFAVGDATEHKAPAWQSPRFIATLILLLVFVPVYLSGHEPARLGLLSLSLVVFGFWLNSLVTEVDLINLSLGHWSAFADNPQRWLLLVFVLVSGVLLGQVWCGYLCPFGALQEMLSRLGRYLGWRGYPQRALDSGFRFVKFMLLCLMLLAVWWSDERFWASFNPMQHAFGFHWKEWMLLLLFTSLIGSLFYFRFWCRYFCPFGAFLALTNKIALLQRFAPKRRFEHCDLGVKDEFDVDCIRCNRCLSGKDCGIRHRMPKHS